MDRVIHRTSMLRCPPAEAYSQFVHNDLLQDWLTNIADVEATLGGKYELFWNPADRENDSTIGCRVTAIAPGQLIAFEWRSPRQFKHFANASDPLTHVVVTFCPTDRGTTVHLVHSGWRSSPDWQEAAAWQERAWGVAFQALENKINGPLRR